MVIAITVFLCVYCAGAIVDATGSFVGPFLVSGCLIASGGLICLPARRIALWEHERNVRLRRQTRQNDYRWQLAQCLSKRRAVSLRVLSVVEFVYVTSMCRWILKCSLVVKKTRITEATRCWKNFGDIFSCLDTTPECDEQTDRQKDIYNTSCDVAR